MQKRLYYCVLCMAVLLVLFSFYCSGGLNVKKIGQLNDIQNNNTTVINEENIRGIYIATAWNINFPSKPSLSVAEQKTELDEILNNAVKSKINMICFQIRPSADSICKSEIFPTSEFLVGEQGRALIDDFDPFLYLIENAHSNDILVYAWINPLRVTTGSVNNPKLDIGALAESNPARIHREWVVAYDDGRLYFDCGIPEVRDLVEDGVAETVRNYDVDGVLFDDYFYPYPIYDENNNVIEFNDNSTYEKYGFEEDKSTWRRNNVNKMIEQCYFAVKNNSDTCVFGVAPCGVWQNDNGTNEGSDTRGFDAYNGIYCDALAWMRKGYIDFIAPQIYWSFGYEYADYGVLVDWWSDKAREYNIDLLISHGIYRYDEGKFESGELTRQIEYAEEKESYKGSIFYGYSALNTNSNGVKDEIVDYYS